MTRTASPTYDELIPAWLQAEPGTDLDTDNTWPGSPDFSTIDGGTFIMGAWLGTPDVIPCW